MFGSVGEQLDQQPGVSAPAQRRLGVVQHRRHPLPVHGVANGRQPGCVQGGEGISAPQCEGLLEQRQGTVIVVGDPSLFDHTAETVQIHGRFADAENVTTRPAGDADIVNAGQDAPKPRQVAVERRTGPLWRMIAPHAVHELLDRHDVIDVDHQRSQHALLPDRAEVDHPAIHPELHTAEHIELRRPITRR